VRDARYAVVFTLVAAIVGVDQATKWYVQHVVALHDSVPVIEGLFHITYVRNTGAAFGLLAQAPWVIRAPLFLAVSALAITVLLAVVRRVGREQHTVLAALAAVLGGALGNLIDRARYGEVIDFLDLQWHGWHWPAFNVADACITIGVAALLVHSFVGTDPSGPPAEPS
jgi:signal peptidase II